MPIPDMKFTLAVNAIIAEDVENNRATDIYQLASAMHEQYPQYEFKHIVIIVEIAVVAFGGAAVWQNNENRPVSHRST